MRVELLPSLRTGGHMTHALIKTRVYKDRGQRQRQSAWRMRL